LCREKFMFTLRHRDTGEIILPGLPYWILCYERKISLLQKVSLMYDVTENLVPWPPLLNDTAFDLPIVLHHKSARRQPL